MWTGTVCVYVCLALLETVLSIDKQCILHNTVPRTHNRSETNNATVDRNSAPCDNFDNGWYRFETGEIATSCVPAHRCGSLSSVWMKDPIPNIGETKENAFCVNNGMGGGSCCLFEIPVNVTNCGGLLVYYFRTGDLLCPSGYCTADLKQCSNGKTSPTGFEPCSDGAPVMSAPVLGVPQLSPHHHQFNQHCDVGFSGSETNIIFTVTWLFDGKVYKTVTLTGGVKTAVITASDWTGHVGQKLSCRVQSYYNHGGNPVKSQLLTSNEYLGTITITPSYQTIVEGQEATFNLTSTLPTLCSQVPPVICKLDVELMVSGGNQDDIYGVGGCSVRFWGHDWDPSTGQVHATAKVSTFDIHSTGSTVHAITYRALSDTLGHPMWTGFVLDPVQLTVTGTMRIRRQKENSYGVHKARMKEIFGSSTEKHQRSAGVDTDRWTCKCKGQSALCDPSIKVKSSIGGTPVLTPPVG